MIEAGENRRRDAVVSIAPAVSEFALPQSGPLVSIVIPTYNGWGFLEPCIASLSPHLNDAFEVIIADDASTDGTSDRAPQLAPQVRVVRLPKNMGFVGAAMAGVQAARGEWILFLNNDMLAEEGFLEAVAAAAKAGDPRSVYMCQQLRWDGGGVLTMGMTMDPFGYPANPIGRGFTYADGAALLIHSRFFAELGGFDRAFEMFTEDLDLGWRAILAGGDLVPVDSARIRHYGGGTAVGSVKRGDKHVTSVRRRYLTDRNSLRAMLKNYGRPSLVGFVAIRAVLDMAESLLLLILLRPRAAGVNPRAWWWNLQNLRSTLTERRRIQALRKVPDRKILARVVRVPAKLLSLKMVGLPIYR